MGLNTGTTGGRGRSRGDNGPWEGLGGPTAVMAGPWIGGVGQYYQTLPESSTSNCYLIELPSNWSQFIYPRTKHRPRPSRIRGAAKFSLIFLEFVVASGSGSNTWQCSPVWIIQQGNPHRDDWVTVPVADKPHTGNIGPEVFTEADLPLREHYRIPIHLSTGNLGLEFERIGAGTNVLTVSLWATR